MTTKNKGTYRSKLEKRVAADLLAKGVPVLYETEKIPFIKPESKHTYLTDFILPNGIIIETKGRLTLFDRQKMILVRACNPSRDIRFVFMRAGNPLRKGSKTTYAMWAEKNGFKWADSHVPQSWIDEKENMSNRRSEISERILWADKIATLVLATAEIMLKADADSIDYYASVGNRRLRENKYYFNGMRDRTEDLKRVVARALQEVITNSDDVAKR